MPPIMTLRPSSLRRRAALAVPLQCGPAQWTTNSVSSGHDFGDAAGHGECSFRQGTAPEAFRDRAMPASGAIARIRQYHANPALVAMTRAATSVARRLVLPPHRDDGQAQFIQAPVARTRESTRLSPLLDWARARLNNGLSIAALARRAGMSRRTLQRRFEETTGLGPGEWVSRERLTRAKSPLESEPAATFEDIVTATGFGSSTTMRHHFRTRRGTIPRASRRQF